MADMMSTLRTLLGDNADEKIQSAMNMLKTSGLMEQVKTASSSPQNNAANIAEAINNDINAVSTAAPKTQTASSQPVNSQQPNIGGVQNQSENVRNVLTPEGVEFVSQIRGMVDRLSSTNDSRSDLLRSLRPFMRTPRQQTIDRAIRIMNIGRFSGLFGSGLFGK